MSGWLRAGSELQEIEEMLGWISPRIGIRFELLATELQIYRPDGQKFVTYVELAQEKEQAQQQAEQERQRAEQERQRAEQERQRAEQAESQLQSLRALLQEQGINPDNL